MFNIVNKYQLEGKVSLIPEENTEVLVSSFELYYYYG